MKLAALCLALATGTAAAHPCPSQDRPAKVTKVAKPAPTEQAVTALFQKAADRIRIAAIVDADAATTLQSRYRTIKSHHALETPRGRIAAAAALEKLATDAEAVLP
jgi:hypothetical protein